MRVIDLLNKIANGEELPEKIKYDGDTYCYRISHEGVIDYYSDIEDRPNLWLFENHNTLALNKEIEVIEPIEDNNIDIEEIETYSEDGVELYDKNSIHFNRKKINELVRKYNELNREIKELKKIEN